MIKNKTKTITSKEKDTLLKYLWNYFITNTATFTIDKNRSQFMGIVLYDFYELNDGHDEPIVCFNQKIYDYLESLIGHEDK
jgi:hypothetical protein